MYTLLGAIETSQQFGSHSCYSSRMKIIIGIVVGLIVIGSVVLFTKSNSSQEPASENATTPSTQESTASTDTNSTADADTTATAEGEYKDYSAEAVSATEGTRLLFFHASWCPQCRALDASIKQSDIPSGVTIFKVDYDSNQALRKQYGVTVQTTVVRLDAQGNLVEKYVAYDQPNFDSVKSNLL
jgi:thiol-disulfide isomerase/thioredoxin